MNAISSQQYRETARSRGNPERAIQRQILDWLKVSLPGAIVFAVPNGGARNKITGAIMKGEGVRAGAPDLILCYRGKIAFLEVKAPKGSLSASQKAFRDDCAENLIPYAVVRGIGDVQAFLDDLGIQVRADSPVKPPCGKAC